MSALSDLPNAGTQVDLGACIHMLYGIQGAIDGVPDKFLPNEIKERLRAFYKIL
jgi:DNA transformation protein